MASGIATAASASRPAAFRPLRGVVDSGIRTRSVPRRGRAPRRPRAPKARILRLLYDSRRTPARPPPTLRRVGIARPLRAFALTAGLASVSCAIGPDYARPALEPPADFAEAPPAAPGDADAALAAWWERFAD